MDQHYLKIIRKFGFNTDAMTAQELLCMEYLIMMGFLKDPGEKSDDSPGDSGEMFYKEAERKRNNRHYYRNLILRSVATFCMGIILVALLEASGLSGFLVGVLLIACGYVISAFT